MTDVSRIRFNPTTKDIEVEGSEEFVKIYFTKMMALLSEGSGETEGEPDAPLPVKAPLKGAKSPYGKKKITNVNAIVALIQGRSEGISTADLHRKTGIAESQIWNIVNRAAREGRIRKLRRGLYAAA